MTHRSSVNSQKLMRIGPSLVGCKCTTRKCGNCACIATWGRQTSRQSFWAVFGQFCTAHVHKIKILKALLDSATPISYKATIIWRSDDVFALRTWPLTRYL